MLLCTLFAAGCSASHGPSVPTAMFCMPPACSVDQTAFAVEVTPPPASSGIARLDVASLMLDANGFFQIQLAPPVVITGQVSVGKAGQALHLEGSVVASRPSRILGHVDETYQTQLDVATGQYSLPVTETLPGEQYTLRVLPTDTSQYPPQTFQVSASVLPGVPRQVGFDLVLDDPSTLTQVQGKVMDPVMNPIAGVQVQAIDPTTKAVVSTTTVTDASGAYAIRLSKSVQKLSPAVVTLTASPTATAPGGTPMLQLPVDISKVPATNSVSADLPAPPLATPAPFSYRVIGVGSSGAETPIVGAQLTFVAVVTDTTAASGVSAVFQAQAQSDTDGVVTAQLVPGMGQTNRTYTVAVAPPSSSDFQARSLMLSVGPTPSGGYGADIQLDVRPLLSGRVVDQSANPVASVTVQPGPSTVANAVQAMSLADVNNVASTATASDGRFTLPVDAGKYDVGLLPLASMKLPRRWIDSLQITADLDVGDVLIPPAALVGGQVLAPDGSQLQNADVQIYAISSATCPNRALTCLSPARLAAESSTDASGIIQVLLPAATAGLPGAL
jgi:hypothetical protein